ncbi:MAG: hypothetical protein SGJ11_14370 [Phycisphaerae bacterium]|nr:hypothetical protein [Phycisphaerae bacterium]
MHKSPRTPIALPDLHEPLDSLEAGVAVETLERIDGAIGAGDLQRARQLEALLPQSLRAEPPVADRLATVRLLAGDLESAAAVLDACPQSTPRLDLLRAVAALRRDDLLAAFAIANGPSARRSLCLRILAAIVSSLTAWEQGVRVKSDPTAAVCETTRETLNATAGIGPESLIPAMRALRQLFPEARPGTFPAAIRAAILSVAHDLAIPLDATPDTLCVTPIDAVRLNLRAA